MSSSISSKAKKAKNKELPAWAVFALLAVLVLAVAGMGVYWAVFAKRPVKLEPNVTRNVPTQKEAAIPTTALTAEKSDDRKRYSDNFQQTHLSHDGKYLRVTNVGDGPDFYGLEAQADMLGYTAGRHETSYIQTWIDLRQHALPADKIINAVWDGNDLVAYQTLEGASLYHLDSKQTEVLKVSQDFRIGLGGCRPSFEEFSPSRRFLVIRSMGETEYCGVFGLYDLKRQAMIDMPGVYNGIRDQIYAFEPTPQDGGETGVFYLDDWSATDPEEGDMPYYEPHKISVLNADNGKTKTIYQGDLSNIVGLRYEYSNLVLVPEGRGVKEIKLKINENDLP